MKSTSALLFLVCFSNLFGQYGVPDPDFIPNSHHLNLTNAGLGWYGNAESTLLLDDGKIMVAGSFRGYNDFISTSIVRLSADGNVDMTFHSPLQATQNIMPYIKQIIALPGGKTLIAGNFTGGTYNHFARLNADGTFDPTFSNDSLDGTINDMTVFPNGNIAIGGTFTHLGIDEYNGILMLSSEGVPVTAFHPANSGSTQLIAALPNGNLLMRGDYQSLNSYFPDGSRDYGFDSTALIFNSSGPIKGIEVLSDGKIMLFGAIFGGSYASPNGLLRLNSDGTTDTTFLSNPPNWSYIVRDVTAFTELSNGQYLIAFQNTANYYPSAVERVNPDGSTDSSFVVDLEITGPASPNYHIKSLTVSENLIIGGNFIYSESNNTRLAYRNCLMQVSLTTGELLPQYYPLAGPAGNLTLIKHTPDGKLMVGGDFKVYDGYPMGGIVRLNADGSRDNTFNSTAAINPVNSFDFQSDGRAVVSRYTYLRRLNADGTFDTTFPNLNNSTNDYYQRVIVDDQDRIYLAKNQSFVRLLADGTSDNTFPEQTFDADIKYLELRNGQLICAGNFTQLNGSPVSFVVRINEDGTIDNTLHMQSGFAATTAFTAHSDSDGNLYLGYTYSGGYMYHLKKFFPSGQLDTSFHFKNDIATNTLFDKVIGIDPQNRFYTQENVQGFEVYIRRYTSDGKRDFSFPQQAVNSSVLNILADTNSLICVGNAPSIIATDTVNGMLKLSDCPGPVTTDYRSAYGSYTWVDGVTYIQDTVGAVKSYSIPGACDSLLILDLDIFDPELHVFTSPSDTGACTGTATLSMDGFAPFNFTIGGTIHQANDHYTFDNLCPGIYTAEAYDNQGNYFTTNLVIASDTNFYQQNPFGPDDVIFDSLSVTVENCDIDYETISDIFLDSVYMQGSDVIALVTVIDASDTTVVEAIFNLPSDTGNYLLQLDLYCPEKSGSSHFAVFTFGVTVSDGEATMELTEKQFEVLIYPNPANTNVSVDVGAMQASLEVTTPNGNIISTSSFTQSTTVDMTGFADGIYLFIVSTDQSRITRKVVKL